MRAVGRAYDRYAADGLHLAETVGTVLAGELAWLGIDFSFAPVLDLDYRRSEIIGDRALHSDPVIVAALGRALLRGFARYGRMGIGKHFPGHGYVVADSHLELPVDARAYAELESRDLLPYRELIDVLGGVMPAHVVYSEVAPVTAGFSSYWLTAILRQRLGFDGAIFSDDLAMAGAAAAGDIAARSAAALAAGCDMILICNDPSAAQSAITGLAEAGCAAAPNPRLERLRPGLVRSGWVNMADDPVLQTARCDLAASVA
jgi:beta-N-acetylhexosaminidase